MSHKISVCTASYHPFTLDDALKGISEAGFKYIEISALSGWMEDVMPDFSFRQIMNVKEKIKNYDLTCVALSGHCSVMDPARLPDFIANIQLANFFGAEAIVSSIDEAHGHENTDRDPNANSLPETLDMLGEVCKNYGLLLALETHGEAYGTGAAIKKVLEDVRSENVIINYDPGNVIFYAEQDPVKDLQSCLDKVGYMHLKDKAGPARKWDFPALGDGYVQLDELIKMVKDDITLSIEIQFVEEGPSSLDEVNTAVKKSHDYLKKLGVF